MIYPIINTIIRSFQDSQSGAFTVQNYLFLFSNKVPRSAIWYTLEVSILTVLFVILISYLLALFLRFSSSGISKIIGTLYLIPRFIPGLVATYAMFAARGGIHSVAGNDHPVAAVEGLNGSLRNAYVGSPAGEKKRVYLQKIQYVFSEFRFPCKALLPSRSRSGRAFSASSNFRRTCCSSNLFSVFSRASFSRDASCG